MGYVGQDVFLFQGTVRENIAYGRPDATDAEVEEAARLAEAHDFIAELPQGYDTDRRRAGPEALGRPAPAALDRPGDPARPARSWCSTRPPRPSTTRPRRRSSARSRRSGRDRTVVVIAHRLSTVRHADRIHVLERGRVVESGTHDELVADGGLYAALWRVQTGEALSSLAD